MSLKEQLQVDIKQSLRDKDKATLATLRMITAEVKQREIDERISLDDAQIVVVLDKMQKQRKDSLRQFLAAKRDDLAEIEQVELKIIQRYLPQPLTDAEIKALIEQTIEACGATSMQQMGQVIGKLKPRTTAYVQKYTEQVDITPWKYVNQTGIAITVIVMAIYVYFS